MDKQYGTVRPLTENEQRNAPEGKVAAVEFHNERGRVDRYWLADETQLDERAERIWSDDCGTGSSNGSEY